MRCINHCILIYQNNYIYYKHNSQQRSYNNIYDLFSKADEFFKPNRIIKLLVDHKNGKRDNSRKIWTIYSFLVWYQEYFVKR